MTREVPPALCYVLPRYDPASGEHFAHTYALLSAIAKRVNLVVIVERTDGVPEFGSARVIVQQRRNPVLRWLEIVGACARVSREGCRCFFVRYSFFGVLAAWIATRLRGGQLYYWHCTSMVFRSRGWSRTAWRQRLRAEWPLALTMRLTDRLVTGTPTLARFYHGAYRVPLAHICVIPNDITASRFARDGVARAAVRARLGLAPAQPVVLYVHRVVERKGAHHLPPILSALRERVADAHLIVVGEGPLWRWLQETVALDGGLSNSVTLVGSVPNKEVQDYYSAADVFLMPSQEEGFPRVLLESMASGLPFVASDVGGVRDICEGEQLDAVVQPGDITGFAERLATILRSEALQGRLRGIGYRRVLQYDTAVVAGETVATLGLGGRPEWAEPNERACT